MKKFLACVVILSFHSFSNCSDAFPTPLDPQLKERITTFEAIQNIHRLAEKITNDAKAYKEWPEPNPYWSQTEQGLYLSAEEYPGSLHTPWGEVKIYSDASHIGYNIKKVFETFRDHLKLEFVENTGEHNIVGGKIRFYLDDYTNEITKEELEQHRGSNSIIIANHPGYPSIYKILAIGAITLPEPKKLNSRENYREYGVVKKNWETMMEQYKQKEKTNGQAN